MTPAAGTARRPARSVTGVTCPSVLAELKKLGTAQNVKVYTGHGIGTNLYGVNFANLGVLQKRIKINHALAVELWATGNADARHLATMTADPSLATEALVDAWVKDLSNYLISDLFAKFVARTSFAHARADKWVRSEDEWIGRAGWAILASLALAEPSSAWNSYFKSHLDLIERDIHRAKNFTRHAMNNALIAIGIRNNALKNAAQNAARRIGKVEVDHGETSCVIPDAVSYIEKAWAHKTRKKS